MRLRGQLGGWGQFRGWGAAGLVVGLSGAAGAALGLGSHKPEQTPLSPSLYSPPQAAAAVGVGPT